MLNPQLKTRGSVTLVAAAVLLAACQVTPPKPPAQPPVQPPVQPPKPLAVPLMTPVPFASLPGWTNDDIRAAWPAWLASCSALIKQAAWQPVCNAARTLNGADADGLRAYFEGQFTPYLLRSPDGADNGLITGYYEAMLNGSRSRGGPYQTPLYRVPDDLITVDLASIYPELKGMRLRGKLVGKKLVPYGARADIDQNPLAGKELMWVDDPTDAFFLEVQGSGRVKLDNGDTVRISYADQNGYPYRSIGRWLVEKGELKLEEASAQGIRAWIAAHPERRQELFNANPSYVFFREEKLPDPSIGPKGSLGVPLTGGRSLAVDNSFVPPGAPVFLSTTWPASTTPLQRLAMAQDTGGAIKGAIRVDIFFGFGSEAVENAGKMKQAGQVWVLLPKDMAPR